MSSSQTGSMVKRAKSLSIVIPTYNESKNIVKILDSLHISIPQDLDTEVIVVDDNSPDGTSNTVEEYAKKLDKGLDIQVIKRENQRGLSSAIVKGIEHAKGDDVV
ncbi:MAG: glycosyltransferase, partial [Nitrososphaera sp.]